MKCTGSKSASSSGSLWWMVAVLLTGCASAPPVDAPDLPRSPEPEASDALEQVQTDVHEPAAGTIVALEEEEVAEGELLARRAEGFRAQVTRQLDSVREELNGCYLPSLKRDPALRGYVVVTLTVGSGGAVTDGPHLVESTLDHRDVEQCVLKLLGGLTYPEPFQGAGVEVSRSFGFGAY